MVVWMKAIGVYGCVRICNFIQQNSCNPSNFLNEHEILINRGRIRYKGTYEVCLQTYERFLNVKLESNPYFPGAGTHPPELAGRDDILADVRGAIRRNKLGAPARNFMFFGLRGVGKTVLLGELRSIAEDEGAVTNLVEVSANERLSITMIMILRAVLLRLDRGARVSEQVRHGLRVLKSFVGAIRVKYHDVEFSIDVDSEVGVADSGILTRDLAEVFVAAGEAARARESAIVILIDEIQNLPAKELEALIMALHGTSQRSLPFMFIGAGLPSIVKMAGDAKSYAERLFEYPKINSLDEKEARRALVKPAAASKVQFEDEAVEGIIERTKGYPYFLQEWGYQAWNVATGSPIKIADIRKASDLAIKRLDENFFFSRYKRLSNPQKDYLRAMAELSPGPHNTGDVAKVMKKSPQQLGTIRESLITGGMIYSPRRGDVAFTVPMFDEFMKRQG